MDNLSRPQRLKLGAPTLLSSRRAPVAGPCHTLFLYVDFAELGRLNHSWGEGKRVRKKGMQRGLQVSPWSNLGLAYLRTETTETGTPQGGGLGVFRSTNPCSHT